MPPPKQDYPKIASYPGLPRLCILQAIKAWGSLGMLQYRSSFQSSTLIGRAVTRSQTSLGVRARFRLWFRAGYDVFQTYAVLISTNQIRALKITPG